jgi:hypothetical protein
VDEESALVAVLGRYSFDPFCIVSGLCCSWSCTLWEIGTCVVDEVYYWTFDQFDGSCNIMFRYQPTLYHPIHCFTTGQSHS